MKAKLYLSLAAILCAWSVDALVGSTTARDQGLLWFFLSLALPLLVLARRNTLKDEPEPSRPTVALSLVLACAATLHELFIPPALVLIAAALLDLSGSLAARPWARAARSLALGFVFALGALRLAESFELTHLGESLLLEPLTWLFSLSGQAYSRVGSALAVDLESETVFLRADYYKAGLSQIMAFSAALIAMSASAGWRQSVFRRLAQILVLILAFCFLRTTVVAILSLSLGQDLRLILAAHWARAWLLLAVPLSVFLISSANRERIVPLRKRLAQATLAAGFLCLMLSFWPGDVGARHPGSILLDESHSSWERSDSSFDADSWGRVSTYAYGSLGRLLEDRGPFRRHLSGDLNDAALADCSVLIIKTPDRPFAANEVEAIKNFVTRGGGLFLIGDHTNLFGMAVHLNDIAEPFGLSFEYNAAYEAQTGGTTFVEEVWPPHPVAAGSSGMAFQTSCTLRPLRPDVQPIFVGRRLAAEDADYSNPNFFGNMRAECGDRLGTFLVAAAVDCGEGRVVAFSDSTILSNFSLYDEGVSEMFRASVGWLERAPSRLQAWLWLLPWLAALFLVLATLGLGMDWAQFPILSATGLLLLALATTWSSYQSRLQNEELLGHQGLDVVSFIADASTEKRTSFIDDALALGAAKTGDGVFGNFFISVQRLGDARPQRHASLRAALREDVAMVVLNQPVRQPELEELKDLARYVTKGGHLLVLDDPSRAANSSANAWLSSFGLSLAWDRADVKVHGASWPGELDAVSSEPSLAGLALGQVILQRSQSRPTESMVRATAKSHYVVRGGDAILLDGQSRVLAAQGRRGQGLVTVHASASMFDDQALGSRASSLVDAQQRSRGAAAVELLRRALGGEVIETLVSGSDLKGEVRHETR